MQSSLPAPSRWISPIVTILAISSSLFLMTLGMISFLSSRSIPPAMRTGAHAERPVQAVSPVVLLTYDSSMTLSVEAMHGLVEVGEMVEATTGVEEINQASAQGVDEAATLAWTACDCDLLALRAGQRVRTGPSSDASLRLSDGRQARLGAGAEVSLLLLDEGTIALVLHRGEILHSAVSSPNYFQ